MVIPNGGFCADDLTNKVSNDPRLLVIVSQMHTYRNLDTSLMACWGYRSAGIGRTFIYDSIHPVGWENLTGPSDGGRFLITTPTGQINQLELGAPLLMKFFRDWKGFQQEVLAGVLPYIKGALLTIPAPRAFPNLHSDLITGKDIEAKLVEGGGSSRYIRCGCRP